MDMEIDSDVSNQSLSLRNQDAEIMVQQLRELLKPNPCTDMEEIPPSGLPEWNDLKSRFDATDEELKSALRRVPAVEFDGRWRYVDGLYIGQVLYHLVLQVLELEESLSSFGGYEVVKSVVDTYGLSPDIARHCLELYASTTDGSVWKLDSQRAYPCLARWITASYGKRMEIQEFFNRWACLKFPLSINMLEGEKIIVVKCYGNRTWISLPPDDQNRSRSNTPTMENTDDEIDPNDFNKRLSLRNEDAGIMVLELRELLLQNPYIPMEESSHDQQPSHLFKWDDLKSRFDATDEELKSALRLVPAVEINGYWRALDVMYTGQLLYKLVERVESNSAFDGNKLVNCLAYEGYSPDIARLCLELCASTADGRVWKLDSERASVEIARWLIASYGARMESQDFMHHWSILGSGESLDMLGDKVLVEKKKNQLGFI
ncbi:uncharacterized protein LOC143529908 isoform X2 [Bidens hawaiensis]|uniref:uncharacterized protein LOC143529908 isoform X2 n=1 Tax=Bidens hawaiensis TaxID=980011 RepID=UPI004049A2C7